MKVLVINQCSTNKGDRAVLFFVLRELASNGVDQITVSTSQPEYWRRKPDIPNMAIRFVPWGWDISRKTGFSGKVIHRLKHMYKRRIHFPVVRDAFIADKRRWYLRFFINSQYLEAVQQADLVLSTGGHHLSSIIVKNLAFPQTFDMAVALLYGKPLVLWAQSVGTFEFELPKDKLNKLMVQKILSSAHQIFIRDEVSAEEIRKMGVSLAHVSQTCESVFGLFDVVISRIRPSDRPPVMGVSVWTGNIRIPEARESYVHCFATLINHAISAGYKVRFFPMELAGTDRFCIEAIISRVDKKENCEIVEGFPGTVDHINAIAQCKIFTGHKTHSQIFSLVAATPLIAIAYHEKTKDFMAQFGLEKHYIADTQLSGAKLVEMFDEVNDNLDAIHEKEREIGYRISEQVKKDFAKMIEDVRTGCR